MRNSLLTTRIDSGISGREYWINKIRRANIVKPCVCFKDPSICLCSDCERKRPAYFDETSGQYGYEPCPHKSREITAPFMDWVDGLITRQELINAIYDRFIA